LTLLSPPERIALIAALKANDVTRWTGDWPQFAHLHQRPPAMAQGGGPWRTWLILGGRGAGKTHAGAQWVRALAQGELGPPVRRIALIGETEHEVREVMVEGVAGLLAAHARHERPSWIPSRRRVEWANGVVAETFSAEDPESLRGPQFGAAWADELSLVECPAFVVTLLHVLWTGFTPGINGFATLSGLMMAYFAARFGVLGVYVSARSREKQAACTGQLCPGMIEQVVKAVTKR
jgi:phage terminase large subunit-like protein